MRGSWDRLARLDLTGLMAITWNAERVYGGERMLGTHGLR